MTTPVADQGDIAGRLHRAVELAEDKTFRVGCAAGALGQYGDAQSHCGERFGGGELTTPVADLRFEVCVATKTLDLESQGGGLTKQDEVLVPERLKGQLLGLGQAMGGAHGDPQGLTVELLNVKAGFVKGEGDQSPIEASFED